MFALSFQSSLMILEISRETPKLNISTGSVQDSLTGFAVSSALESGAKGHNKKGNYLTGKPHPLGCGASFVKAGRNRKSFDNLRAS
jgi:hypothetical protein